jgi:hypothetical protein
VWLHERHIEETNAWLDAAEVSEGLVWRAIEKHPLPTGLSDELPHPNWRSHGSKLGLHTLETRRAGACRGRGCLRHLGDHAVPINSDARNCRELCLSFELENRRASLTSSLELVDGHCKIDGVDEPGFANAGALISGKFDGLVMGRGRG